jgi:hypothetical protein
MVTQTGTHRSEMMDEIRIRLGASMVDVELDPADYDVAINMALRYYRQRSTNAQIEAFAFLQVQQDIPAYTLPADVQEVRAVYRNNLGSAATSGPGLEPFSASFMNNIYMIQNPGNISTGGSGVLATYDLAMGFQKLTGKMFGRDVLYTWDGGTKRITFHRRFMSGEEIGLHVYMTRPEEVLFVDHYARPWLEDMATAQAKAMLGQGRGKFSSLAGPQGGITLNGAELKSEAATEIATLLQELKDGIDATMGYSFTIG